MKLAIISDVHDNVWNLERVLAAISRDGAQALIMCGDFCAPFTLRLTPPRLRRYAAAQCP